MWWPEPEASSAYAKILYHAKGKRHAFTSIPLTDSEDAIVRRCIDETKTDYFLFVLGHECEINPQFP